MYGNNRQFAKMFEHEKNHKILNLLGIFGIALSFVLTVTFNALAGSGN